MDLEEARKALAKPATFPWKRAAFGAVAGLCLVAGIVLRTGVFSGTPEEAAPALASPPPAASPSVDTTQSVAKTAPPVPEPATAPATPAESTAAVEPADQNAAVEVGEPAEQPAAASGEAGQPAPPDQGTILIARQPVAMLASPSADAKAMYGFPAGRPFRVIGREGSFAKIQDLKSGASGWIDAAALEPPPRAPSVAAPSAAKPSSRSTATSAKPQGQPKPKAADKRGGRVAAESEPSAEAEEPQAPPNRPGILFGRGGFFGGLFGGN